MAVEETTYVRFDRDRSGDWRAKLSERDTTLLSMMESALFRKMTESEWTQAANEHRRRNADIFGMHTRPDQIVREMFGPPART